MVETAPRLSWSRKIILLARVWILFLTAEVAVRREGLPAATRQLGSRRSHGQYPAALLSRAVSRGLRIGPWTPRCLYRSLVLYALLRETGGTAELVIGIRPDATSSDAHAWVEVAGRDVGPDPGSLGAVELIRNPRKQIAPHESAALADA